jgi:hypothetical protein
LLIAGAFCAALSFTIDASAQTLDGGYQFVAEGSADITAAIEGSVGKMNFIKRPIARSRLKKANPAYRTITIKRAADQILVALDGGTPVQMPASGAIVKWKRDDGEVVDVSGQWQASTLTQKFTAEDGARLNVFRLSADGQTLTLDVKLTSDQLPAPLTYSLAYRRTQ